LQNEFSVDIKYLYNLKMNSFPYLLNSNIQIYQYIFKLRHVLNFNVSNKIISA